MILKPSFSGFSIYIIEKIIHSTNGCMAGGGGCTAGGCGCGCTANSGCCMGVSTTLGFLIYIFLVIYLSLYLIYYINLFEII